MELHGGTLTVEIEEGKGSTFTVRLPRGMGMCEAQVEQSA